MSGVWQEDDAGPYEYEPVDILANTPGTANALEPAATEVGETDPMGNIDFLRVILQEVIPLGKADVDTIFLDDHLVEIWNRSGGVLSAAAAMGWSIKTGALLVMTDRNDGLSEKKLSQAATAAKAMADMWAERALVDMKSFGRSAAVSSVAFRPYDDAYSDLWNQLYEASHPDRFWLAWNVIDGG